MKRMREEEEEEHAGTSGWKWQVVGGGHGVETVEWGPWCSECF